MPLKTFQLSDAVRDVLARSTITDTSVALPPEQLDRALYLEVNKALEAAGGKWNRKGRVHLFPSDPREALGLQIAEGVAINKQKTLQAFYTPEPLAQQVVSLVNLRPGMRVLEPSAGEGALVHAAFQTCPQIHVTAVEIDPETRRRFALRFKEEFLGAESPRLTLIAADFLHCTPEATFDAVVMNPPFSDGQEILHIRHAFDHLKPGGRLASVTSHGWTFSKTKAREEFRAFVKEHEVDHREVAAGVFRESGTDIRTLILVLAKPS